MWWSLQCRVSVTTITQQTNRNSTTSSELNLLILLLFESQTILGPRKSRVNSEEYREKSDQYQFSISADWLSPVSVLGSAADDINVVTPAVWPPCSSVTVSPGQTNNLELDRGPTPSRGQRDIKSEGAGRTGWTGCVWRVLLAQAVSAQSARRNWVGTQSSVSWGPADHLPRYSGWLSVRNVKTQAETVQSDKDCSRSQVGADSAIFFASYLIWFTWQRKVCPESELRSF